MSNYNHYKLELECGHEGGAMDTILHTEKNFVGHSYTCSICNSTKKVVKLIETIPATGVESLEKMPNRKNKSVERRIKESLLKEFETLEDVNIELEEERYTNLGIAIKEIAKELSKEDIREIEKLFQTNTFLGIRAKEFKKWRIAKFFHEKEISTFQEGWHGVKVVFGVSNSVWLQPIGIDKLLTPHGIFDYLFDLDNTFCCYDKKMIDIDTMWEAAKILTEAAVLYQCEVFED